MNTPIPERYRDRITGMLTCHDRRHYRPLQEACHHMSMTSFLHAHHIRIFDYPRIAEPPRDLIGEGAEKLAVAAGTKIEHVANAHIRKDDVVAAVIKTRSDHPGRCISSRRLETVSSAGVRSQPHPPPQTPARSGPHQKSLRRLPLFLHTPRPQRNCRRLQTLWTDHYPGARCMTKSAQYL